jgi:hypothetical protein
VLFVARHRTYYRNFESVIRLFAARGHAVHLASERDEALGGAAMVDALMREHPSITAGEAPGREADEWLPLATKLRLAVDYLRYVHPMYDGTPKLRARAAERSPAFAVTFGDSALARSALARRMVTAVLRGAERALPPSTRIEQFLKDQQPDVMLITPLVGVIETPQPDYVRAARRLGIPTALCVWSWDHLSSKALIRDLPDRVLVWNDVQRDEAVRLHHVPRERVVTTGAQCFDQWFGRQPSRSRAQFLAEAGLPPDRPFVLYVGSALFRGSPSEAAFARRWIEAVRGSTHETLRTAGILVRPHPQRRAEWDAIDVSMLDGVSVRGDNPVTEQARHDYFDALYHSAAVVGLNTSAFLEAAIAGRPVLAIVTPEFADNQEGTIHFHYLTTAGGGLLRIGRSLDEHVAQLASALAEPDVASASTTKGTKVGAPTGAEPVSQTGRNAPFVTAFLRPRGLDTPATPLFVDAVETLAREHVPAALPRPSLVGRAALRTLRVLDRSPRGRLWLMDEEDRRSHDRRAAKIKAADEQRAEREDDLRRKAAAKDERARRRQADIDAWRDSKRHRPGAR